MFKIGDKLYDLHEVSKILIDKTADPQFPVKLRELANSLDPIKPGDWFLCDKITSVTDIEKNTNHILEFTVWYLRTIESHKYIIRQCVDIVNSLSVKNWNHILKPYDLVLAFMQINAIITEGYVFKTNILDEIKEIFGLLTQFIDSEKQVETYLYNMGAIIQKL